MDNKSKRGGQEVALPDAANLFYALRSMGYENTAAVADLIDNSIDAKANTIRITIDEDLSKIYIADNGVGMSEDTLRTSIRLGGKKDHSDRSDLGKYGLGLITASISMGRSIRIITKHNNEYHSAVLDCDEISRANDFVVNIYESTAAEIQSFDFRTDKATSGTVLIIDKCDKLQFTKYDDFARNLSSKIAQTFRVYLRNNNHIFVNDHDIEKNDVMLLERGAKTLVDADIDIKNPNGQGGTMHVLAVEAPDFGSKINSSLRLSIPGQGFYILRNNREIAAALEFPEVFKKHGDFNLLRIELNFGPDLDDLMGVNLKKHEIAPSQEVLSKLKDLLSEEIDAVRARAKKKQAEGKNKKNPFKPAAPITTPPTPKVDGGSVTPSEKITPPAEPELIAPSDKPEDYEFVFSVCAGSASEQLFKLLVTGKTIVIRYNIKSDFYAKSLLSDSSIPRYELDKFIINAIKSFMRVAGRAQLERFADELARSFEEKE